METPSPLQIAGIAGFLSYVIAFVSLQVGWMNGATTRYAVWSLCSALLVLVSLTEHFNLPAALIQSTWVVIALTAIAVRGGRLAATGGLSRSGAAFRATLTLAIAVPMAVLVVGQIAARSAADDTPIMLVAHDVGTKQTAQLVLASDGQLRERIAGGKTHRLPSRHVEGVTIVLPH